MASGSAMVGLGIVLAFVLMALAAAWIAPYGADQQSLTERLKPPSTQHLFGTDDLGRDVLSRVMFGSQISLRVGLLAVVLSLVLPDTVRNVHEMMQSGAQAANDPQLTEVRFLERTLGDREA